jgi:phosphatidylglycerophosphate synthase
MSLLLRTCRRWINHLTFRTHIANLISILRMLLALFALGLVREWTPWPADLLVVVGMLVTSRLLDLTDGYFARRFGSNESVGSVVDMLVDLATHTIVWSISGLWFAPALILLEWVGGVGILLTGLSRSEKWKTALSEGGPRWIQAYFRKNQRNVMCGYASVCHFLFPIAAFADFNQWVQVCALPGLVLYEAVTAYLVVSTVRTLLRPER